MIIAMKGKPSKAVNPRNPWPHRRFFKQIASTPPSNSDEQVQAIEGAPPSIARSECRQYLCYSSKAVKED